MKRIVIIIVIISNRIKQSFKFKMPYGILDTISFNCEVGMRIHILYIRTQRPNEFKELVQTYRDNQ